LREWSMKEYLQRSVEALDFNHRGRKPLYTQAVFASAL
jgi:hypothetical protein